MSRRPYAPCDDCRGEKLSSFVSKERKKGRKIGPTFFLTSIAAARRVSGRQVAAAALLAGPMRGTNRIRRRSFHSRRSVSRGFLKFAVPRILGGRIRKARRMRGPAA